MAEQNPDEHKPQDAQQEGDDNAPQKSEDGQRAESKPVGTWVDQLLEKAEQDLEAAEDCCEEAKKDLKVAKERRKQEKKREKLSKRSMKRQNKIRMMP